MFYGQHTHTRAHPHLVRCFRPNTYGGRCGYQLQTNGRLATPDNLRRWRNPSVCDLRHLHLANHRCFAHGVWKKYGCRQSRCACLPISLYLRVCRHFDGRWQRLHASVGGFCSAHELRSRLLVVVNLRFARVLGVMANPAIQLNVGYGSGFRFASQGTALWSMCGRYVVLVALCSNVLSVCMDILDCLSPFRSKSSARTPDLLLQFMTPGSRQWMNVSCSMSLPKGSYLVEFVLLTTTLTFVSQNFYNAPADAVYLNNGAKLYIDCDVSAGGLTPVHGKGDIIITANATNCMISFAVGCGRCVCLRRF